MYVFSTIKEDRVETERFGRISVLFFLTWLKILSLSALLWGITNIQKFSSGEYFMDKFSVLHTCIQLQRSNWNPIFSLSDWEAVSWHYWRR
jgi:hypothetical protein